MTVGCFLSLPEVMAASWHCSVGVLDFWTKVFRSETDKVEIPRWLGRMSNEWKDIFTGSLYVSCDSWRDLIVTNIVDEEKADRPGEGARGGGRESQKPCVGWTLLMVGWIQSSQPWKGAGILQWCLNRNVSGLQEAVIGSDLLTFSPRTWQADALASEARKWPRL